MFFPYKSSFPLFVFCLLTIFITRQLGLNYIIFCVFILHKFKVSSREIQILTPFVWWKRTELSE